MIKRAKRTKRVKCAGFVQGAAKRTGPYGCRHGTVCTNYCKMQQRTGKKDHNVGKVEKKKVYIKIRG